ncbi:MAG TPA: hypothetical protein VMH91_04060 [Candidatus Paceibacterota bacterium]|nr:hypothetical protein [Candidatus Paceibacterota bacterium]
MNFLARTFVSWLPLGIAVTLLCALVYGTVQQNYRQSLNDPQIQMAEDTAAQLAGGSAPEQIVSAPAEIDLANSLAPWVAIYSATGTPLVSSGELNGDMPAVPQGVFAAAKASQGKDTAEPYEDRVTWQAGAGVRQAIVVVWVPRTGQYVASGRNMFEVEDREGRLSFMVSVVWAGTMVATFIAQAFAQYLL